MTVATDLDNNLQVGDVNLNGLGGVAEDFALEINGLTKRFGEISAVDDVTLAIPPGSFVTLVGPSGCGKTTLLRMIAGLETPTDGVVRLHGETVFSASDRVHIPPHRRHLGMVFQSYALWPHMSAFENVAYPLRRDVGLLKRARRNRHDRAELDGKVREALSLVGCEELGDRYPSEMSGGQQQRIALARAVVNSPKVVLMDEPLSNLDAKLRSHLQFELRNLQQRLGFTAVYVTHDRSEALSMADTVVVLKTGRLEQIGTPMEIYETPATNYVSDFLGDHNIVDGTVVSASGFRAVVATPLGQLTAKVTHEPVTGDSVLVGVPRDAVGLRLDTPTQQDEQLPPSVPAEVVGVSYCGWFSEVLVQTEDQIEATVRVLGAPPAEVGDRVWLEPTGRLAHLEHPTDDSQGALLDSANDLDTVHDGHPRDIHA